MARFMSPANVVDNSFRGLRPANVDAVLAGYGRLAELVRIVRAEEISRTPGAIWLAQSANPQAGRGAIS